MPVPLNYPVSAVCDHVDTYHGIEVPDPYRWLEDANSDQTRRWIADQNALTHDYLQALPHCDRIHERLTQLWHYERYGCPWKVGDCYYYFQKSGLQNQSVLYAQATLASEPVVILDPNQWSADGTLALTQAVISENGQYLAYGVSAAGSDWQEWSIRDLKTGSDLNDHLQWIKFSSVSWTPDDQGFFYSRYDAPQADQALEAVNSGQQLYYHRLGTEQSADVLIYSAPEHPDWGFIGNVTQDGRYLVITVWQGTNPNNQLFYLDLKATDASVVKLIDSFHAKYHFIDNQGTCWWLETDKDAPRGQVIEMDLNPAQPQHWRTVIAQSEDILQSVGTLNHQFIATYLRNAHTVVQRFDLTGQPLANIELPGIGTVQGFQGKRTDTETFYTYTSFTAPTSVYHFDCTANCSDPFRQPQLDYPLQDYVTQQIFYPSTDGTQVSMFLIHHQDIILDGNNPTLLYGYGGFNISLTPNFSAQTLLWLELGGVYAVANLRGGGEYGQEWHQAGMRQQKQTVFDDFLAAAEWLIHERYTQPHKLAIKGGSNGGLLVGACMTQRPDLFAAALPAVGVMDMLRFSQFTIGWAWEPEYGSPTQPEDFKTLLAYSPLHNLKSGTAYPATLITTADHDDRVVPAHSFKFAARLQAVHQGESPVLIRIETQAGHGAGKPSRKAIDELTDQLSFLVEVLDMERSQTAS